MNSIPTCKKFRGTYTVLVTPFSADGRSLDVPALKRLVDWQIAEGIHGLIPLGSTGEFLSMTMDEQEEVIDVCVKQAAGRVPVLIGTGAEWTDEAVMKAKLSEKLGADGVMIIPPYYSTPTDDEMFVHFKKISEAISIPVMLYNNPATSNVDLKPEFVARLAQIDNVLYIKESTLEVTRVRDIIDLCGEKMTVFAGILGFESFWLGAQGWVAVCSNFLPSHSALLFELAFEQKNQPAALALYKRILPLVKMVGGHRYVAASKDALHYMGLPVGYPRPPRLPLPEGDCIELKILLDKLALRNSIPVSQ
jgi:4-hydroxy-tetrahydrodipicolinate synthase